MPRSFLRLLPERLAMFLMAIIFVVLLGQIIARFLGVPFNWGQEFTVNAFIWFVFFSIAEASIWLSTSSTPCWNLDWEKIPELYGG